MFGCDQAGSHPAGRAAAYDHDTSQHVGPYYVMGYENFNRKKAADEAAAFSVPVYGYNA
jgi:hypothetical protein